jgi:hypothetical protein
MSDIAVTYGAAETAFGAVTGWGYKGTTSDVNHGTAEALDGIGNVAESQLIDEKISVTSTLECYDDTNTIPDEIGEVIGTTNVLENISITTDAKASSKMTLAGHNHTANAHATLKSVAHGITVTSAIGVTDFLGGTAGAAAALKSSSCTISCQHVDETGADGDGHFCGENNKPMVTATVVWLGVPTTPCGSGWEGVESLSTVDESTGFTTTTVTARKYLAFT